MTSSVFYSSVFCFTTLYYISLYSSCSVISSVSGTTSFSCGEGANSFPFCNTSLPADARVSDLVQRLTLQEKVTFLVDDARNLTRLGIPTYRWWSEALHGVASMGRGVVNYTAEVPGATSFPAPILTAASYNVSLFEAIGKVVSTEARVMYNVGMIGLTFWSPNINIFRDPRWGRGQETPGEDPLLTSRYGSAYVRGLQGTDGQNCQGNCKNRLKVAACCKHYTAYDLDNWKGVERFTFNAVVTKQDMDDTFQPPFKSCVLDGNAASVMCSYQQVNGIPACADPDLLSGVVRGQWKLNGYIVTDCDSVEVYYVQQHYTKTPEEAAAKALLAGVDLDCGNFLGQYTEGAVQGGLITEADVNRALANNFGTWMRLGFFDGDPSKQPYGNLGPKDVCTPENQELAREAARQGIVLHKNNPGSLPLSPTAIKSLAVIGPNSNASSTMIGNYAGSPCQFITPLHGLTAVVPTTFVAGCDIDNVSCITAQVDATVLVVGEDQSIEQEGFDRTDVFLPGQQTLLITDVAKASKGPVILVVMSGGGFDITFAKFDDKITSILWVGYPGEAGGAAIADVIFGFHNPSGRLPMTWSPQAYVDNVPMTNMNMRPDNATGYPGRTYRFYTGDTVYAFGYGLSYSTFNHSLVQAPNKIYIPLEEDHVCHSSSCLSLDVVEARCQNLAFDIHLGVKNMGKMSGSHTVLLYSSPSSSCLSLDVVEARCQNLAFDIHLGVKNMGKMSGSHTVLLYSSPPFVHNAPKKQLLGFEKVFLSSQGEALVKFNVDVCKHLRVVDEQGNRKVALGDHVLHVGDLKQTLTVGI